eukprot:Colp12_sorted_trinity150504_noHs@13380
MGRSLFTLHSASRLAFVLRSSSVTLGAQIAKTGSRESPKCCSYGFICRFQHSSHEPPASAPASAEVIRRHKEAKKLRLESAGRCLGKQETIKCRGTNALENCQCGEDAFFVAETESQSLLGVADGVGGWNEIGVDPSAFSWALMNNCAKFAHSERNIDAPTLLTKAFDLLVSEKQVAAGSATACLATFDKKTHKLTVANLGDSGLMVVRKGKVIHKTKEQQIYFNAPFQLAVMPDHLKAGAILNTPADADVSSIELKEDDLIVAATDGLLDNMFDDEIVEELTLLNPPETPDVSAEPSEEEKPAPQRRVIDMATSLVLRGCDLSHDSKRMSPFARGATAAGHYYTGGKVDDITVIVARVVASHL